MEYIAEKAQWIIRTNDERIKKALVVGAYNKCGVPSAECGIRFRRIAKGSQVFEAGYVESKQDPANEIETAIDAPRKHRKYGTFSEDRLYFRYVGIGFFDNSRPIEIGGYILRIFAAVLLDDIDDAGHGKSSGGFVSIEFGLECLFECGKSLGSGERIESEIDLKIHCRMYLRVRSF